MTRSAFLAVSLSLGIGVLPAVLHAETEVPAAAPTIESQVLQLVATKAKMKSEDIQPSSTLKSLGFDSLGSMNLALEINKQFHIAMPASAFVHPALSLTIEALTTQIKECQAKAATQPA